MSWVGLSALAMMVPLQALGKRNQDVTQWLLDTAGLVNAFRVITPERAQQEQ